MGHLHHLPRPARHALFQHRHAAPLSRRTSLCAAGTIPGTPPRATARRNSAVAAMVANPTKCTVRPCRQPKAIPQGEGPALPWESRLLRLSALPAKRRRKAGEGISPGSWWVWSEPRSRRDSPAQAWGCALQGVFSGYEGVRHEVPITASPPGLLDFLPASDGAESGGSRSRRPSVISSVRLAPSLPVPPHGRWPG